MAWVSTEPVEQATLITWRVITPTQGSTPWVPTKRKALTVIKVFDSFDFFSYNGKDAWWDFQGKNEELAESIMNVALLRDRENSPDSILNTFASIEIIALRIAWLSGLISNIDWTIPSPE